MLDFLVITALLTGATSLTVGLLWCGLGWKNGTVSRGFRPIGLGALLIGAGLATPMDSPGLDDPLLAQPPEAPLPPPGAPGHPPPPGAPGHPPPPGHMLPPPGPPPLEVDRIAPRVSVDSHTRRACSVNAQGQATCWGEPTPDLNAGGARIVEVAAGREHVCALRTDARVFCTGDDGESKRRVPDVYFSRVEAGNEHNCGLTQDQQIACWGRDDPRTQPPSGRFVRLSVGAIHGCAIDLQGEAQCWGCEDDTTACTAPPGPFTQVSAGHQHSCALRPDGSPVCWGSNEAGQARPPAGLRLRTIVAGWSQSCGLSPSGEIHCWGCTGRLQRLLPEHRDHCAPPAGRFAALSSGDMWGACAVDDAGVPTCWGGLSREGDPR